MATGTTIHYNSGWVKLLSKLINLASGGDKIKVSLHLSAYTPDRDAHDFWDDLDNEASGTGYTAGGLLLAGQAVTQDNPGDRAIFSANDLTFPTVSITFRYAVLYAHFVTSIRTAALKWTVSGSGTDEYWADLLGGGDPSISSPGGVDANDLQLTPGTVGSLAVGEWDYGDNDANGFNTVYVRLLDGADPDSKAAGYVATFEPDADPLLAYIDFAADLVYAAQNVAIDFPSTGIFGAGGV